MTSEVFEEGLDRDFLWASSLSAEPICRAFELLRFRIVAPLGKFDTFENKITEVAYRAIVCTVALLATITGILPLGIFLLGITSKILRGVGFALQKDNFTYIKGQGAEKNLDGSVKLVSWNVGGIGGGMHYDHCGTIPWRLRVDSIVQNILKEDADVIVLQEIYDTGLLEALVEKLNPHYPHFFTHLGANIMGSIGGGMVITKCPVHKFSNESFNNNHWTLNRTFTSLEISEVPGREPVARILGTHLTHNDNEKRMEQLTQMREHVVCSAPLPTILMGDLNLEKNKPEEGGILDTFLTHSFANKYPITATNALLEQWEEKWDPKKQGTPGEKIDYISQFRDGPQGCFSDAGLIEAFDDTFNTRTATSDHHGLKATLHYRKKA